jgi:hypothetical protein
MTERHRSSITPGPSPHTWIGGSGMHGQFLTRGLPVLLRCGETPVEGLPPRRRLLFAGERPSIGAPPSPAERNRGRGRKGGERAVVSRPGLPKASRLRAISLLQASYKG